MQLLIVTQAVDRSDPVLGFFHTWINAYAKSADRVHVVCLREGVHDLARNVHVHSLGKESGASRLMYVVRFFSLVWSLRSEYDAVFVHMNQEYVLLAGLFWRLAGKRVVLWRNHAVGTIRTRIAGAIAHTVCYTSPSSYTAQFRNAVRMPIGIDTERFIVVEQPPEARSILFLGRIDPSKRVREFISALIQLARGGVPFTADIYGAATPGNESYEKRVREDAASLVERGLVRLHGSVRNEETPPLYASHQVYVNLTQSGSFDKTIGEALASGCAVVTCNAALQSRIPSTWYLSEVSADGIARALRSAMEMEEGERARVKYELRRYIEKEHALDILIERVLPYLRSDLSA